MLRYNLLKVLKRFSLQTYLIQFYIITADLIPTKLIFCGWVGTYTVGVSRHALADVFNRYLHTLWRTVAGKLIKIMAVVLINHALFSR